MEIDRNTEMRRKAKLDFKGLLILVSAAGIVVQGFAWTKKETFGWEEISNGLLWLVLLVVSFNLYLSDFKRGRPPEPPLPPPTPGGPPV